MKIKKYLMILFLLFFTIPVFAQETDSIGIYLGKGITLRADFIPFGNTIRCTYNKDTGKKTLEAFQFAGSGASLSFMKGRFFGISGSLLLYSGEDNKVFPVFAGGLVLKLHKLMAISLGWDFGDTDYELKNMYERRLILLTTFTYPIKL